MSKTNSIDPLLVLTDDHHSLVAQEEPKREDEFQAVLSARYQIVEEEEEVSEHFTYMDSAMMTTFPIENHPTEVEKLTITVVKGDTLWNLAQKHEVAVEQIKEWNELENETIHVDQDLVLFSEENDLIHIVQPGETLHRIAKEYEVSIATIKEKNELYGDLIYPGDVLQVTK